MRIAENGNVGINVNNPLALLQVKDGSILANGGIGSTPTSGAGTRFMWIPEKSAIRGGYVSGDYWDASKIGNFSCAFGNDNRAEGEYSLSLGQGSHAELTNDVAIGYGNLANGTWSLAMGNASWSGDIGSIAIGSGLVSNGNYSLALGNTSTSSGDNSIAIGTESTSLGNSSVSIGYQCQANGDKTFAIGEGAIADDEYTFAAGFNVKAEQVYSVDKGATAMGWNTISRGRGTTAIGEGCTAIHQGAVALGYQCTANGTGATAIGDICESVGEGGPTAMGKQTYAEGRGAFAIGYLSKASNDESFAQGYDCRASGDHAISMGHNSKSQGHLSVSIGYDCNVSASHSTAIGSNIDIAGTNCGSMIFSDWGDDCLTMPTTRTASTIINQITMKFKGDGNSQNQAYRFFTNNNATTGSYMTCNTSGWTNFCDSNLKNVIEVINSEDILNSINRIPLSKWEYKDAPNIHYIGPMAQDFSKEFKLNGKDSLGINTIDIDGVNFAGIKALIKRTDELKFNQDKMNKLSSVEMNGGLERILQENEELKNRVKVLEDKLKILDNISMNTIDCYEEIILEQNIPNPLIKDGYINYYIPTKFSDNAEFIITDPSGKNVIQKISPVIDKPGQIVISFNDYTTGVYLYGIQINGKLVKSKKMLVIK